MTLSELFDKADEMVAKRYPDCNASIKEMNSYRDGYIHGMTEKLEGMIPIEKACDWFQCMALDYMQGDITDVKWGSMFADLHNYIENGDD